ncbi:MAG: PilT/PilU family type 4a pilus ATPase [Lentisphaeria bacterium]|nr:PilT/PilU family type 4a pilus ATPase [Lentisphaeria bacterium]
MPLDQISAIMQCLLMELRVYGASDLHISAMSAPFIRRNLELERLEEIVLSREVAEKCNFCLLTVEQAKQFRKEQDMTFALEIGSDRFRTALILHKDGIAGSYRLVPDQIPSLADLGFLPKDVETLERLMDYPNGLVLVTGPIGSGKTTTLASLVDIANSRRQDHIITVEDPIEILQKSKSCQVTQRQVGKHTKSYSTALKGALREDPDIIVIGEMHDLETIENAITAAETGHLVIGTLHTRDAANTMNRILDVFPPNQQPQIRSMTAGSLRGVLCQNLVKGVDGRLTVVYEILINTLAIANVINEGKIFQLKGNMQIGAKVGMCTIDQNLLEKWKVGAISYETAREGMTDKSVIALLEKENAVLQAQRFAQEAAAKAAAEEAAKAAAKK